MSSSSPSDPEARLRQAMAVMWQRNLPTMRARLEELDRAAEHAEQGILAAELRSSAAGTAHKLAGSVAMFGFPQGTDIAREIEQMLDSPKDVNVARLKELTASLHVALKL